MGLEPLVPLVEALQVGQPLHLAGGDVVEGPLHPRGEAGVHQIREVLLQQGGHGKGREAGGQRVVLQRRVTAIDDGADDRGVGRGATDAFLLKHLHQGSLAVASRGLGLVTQRFDGLAAGAVAGFQARQQDFLPFKGGIGVIAALDVGPEETGEVNALAIGAEAGGPKAAAINLQLNAEHG